MRADSGQDAVVVAAVVAALLSVTAAAPGAAAAAAAPAPVAAASPKDRELAIMRRLREAVAQSNPDWAAHEKGWDPGSSAHPCTWAEVVCHNQHVTILALDSKSHQASSGELKISHNVSSPLLPDLAQLPWLEQLTLVLHALDPWPRIPPEWLAPGAFPSLQMLSLTGSLATPLPDIPPGALPRLARLYLVFLGLRSTLPPSWGSDPAILPALQQLQVAVEVAGGLPAAWGGGFPQLRTLSVFSFPPGTSVYHLHATGSLQEALGDAVRAQAVGPHHTEASRGGAPAGGVTFLPPEWAAAGSFPKLHTLELDHLGLVGSLPLWRSGGFPRLQTLSLALNHLAGSPPADLLDSMPQLKKLVLEGNELSGTLPDSWAASKVEVLSLADNSLTGPALPSAWLGPHSLPNLITLDLSGNHGLRGTLPTNLSWPNLSNLHLDDSGINGSIPEAWCRAPFARSIATITLEGTAADTTLPPCAAEAFSRLFTAVVANARARAAAPQPASSPHSPSGSATSLAALVPLLALVAAGAGGRVMLSRRLRQRMPHSAGQPQGMREQVGLLQSNDQHQPNLAPAGGGAVTRKRRVEALLRSTLARGGAIRLTGMPLHGVARQVDTLSKLQGGHGREEAELAAGSGADIEAQAGVAAWEAAEGSYASSLLRGQQPWQWGLASTTLQIHPGDLQLETHAGGEFVALGAGGQAVVYRARLQGMPVAAKMIELDSQQDPGMVWREVALMRQCMHERVVPLYGVALLNGLAVLAMDLIEGGTLESALLDPDTRADLRWEAGGRQVAIDVAEGLAFLHSEAKVLHGDLKPRNVLLTADLRACLSDFGLSQALASKAQTIKGFTLVHAAPEQLMAGRCTLAADLYSFGLILVELTTQSRLSRRGAVRLPQAPADCSEAVLALIQECISPDPAARPSAAQALQRLRADGGQLPSQSL